MSPHFGMDSLDEYLLCTRYLQFGNGPDWRTCHLIKNANNPALLAFPWEREALQEGITPQIVLIVPLLTRRRRPLSLGPRVSPHPNTRASKKALV